MKTYNELSPVEQLSEDIIAEKLGLLMSKDQKRNLRKMRQRARVTADRSRMPKDKVPR